MKKNRTLMLIIFLSLFLQGCANTEESIAYGDIDFSAEEIEITKPKNGIASENIVGNTYLNLLQNGLFAENNDFYFYIINYNNENILIREDKVTNNKEKIFIGNIRNLFIIDNWIYGVENNISTENMIVMDINGNNIFRSIDFKKEVRTMISDGEKIYFTVDASNLINNEFNSGIYSCNMDFSELKTEKQTENSCSQVDLITKYKSKIIFNETYSAKDVDNFVFSEIEKKEYPLLMDENIYTIDNNYISELLGLQASIITLNENDDTIFISLKSNNNYYILILKNNEYELLQQEEEISQIYVLSNDVIIYDGKYFRRLRLD